MDPGAIQRNGPAEAPYETRARDGFVGRVWQPRWWGGGLASAADPGRRTDDQDRLVTPLLVSSQDVGVVSRPQLAASEIPRFVYATTTHADDIARYSKLVIEAAEGSDQVANAILKDAGRELGACVIAVAQRLKIADREFPVAFVGGAFNAGELLLAPMREAVTAKAPRANIGPPQRTPVEGAAMMAIRAAAAPRPSRSRA